MHAVIGWSDDLEIGAVQFPPEHGADVNARRKDLSTPLHLAAVEGNLDAT